MDRVRRHIFCMQILAKTLDCRVNLFHSFGDFLFVGSLQTAVLGIYRMWFRSLKLIDRQSHEKLSLIMNA